MALSVATLSGFPSINTTFQRTAGTPTDAATFAFTNGVYTQSGTQYVAGIIDQQGINPTRIFFCDNNTGSGTTGATVALPTLVSVTQVSAHGQSIQELPSTTFEVTDKVGYSGFVVLLNAAIAGADDGVYPLGYNNAIPAGSGPGSGYANVPGWVSQGGAYTGTTTVGYPNPQMRFFLTFNAMLLLASTSTG